MLYTSIGCIQVYAVYMYMLYASIYCIHVYTTYQFSQNYFKLDVKAVYLPPPSQAFFSMKKAFLASDI